MVSFCVCVFLFSRLLFILIEKFPRTRMCAFKITADNLPGAVLPIETITQRGKKGVDCTQAAQELTFSLVAVAALTTTFS